MGFVTQRKRKGIPGRGNGISEDAEVQGLEKLKLKAAGETELEGPEGAKQDKLLSGQKCKLYSKAHGMGDTEDESQEKTSQTYSLESLLGRSE